MPTWRLTNSPTVIANSHRDSSQFDGRAALGLCRAVWIGYNNLVCLSSSPLHNHKTQTSRIVFTLLFNCGLILKCMFWRGSCKGGNGKWACGTENARKQEPNMTKIQARKMWDWKIWDPDTRQTAARHAKLRIQTCESRAIKLGYYDTQSATARDLFCDADDALFHKILYNKAHLLHMYLPDRSQIVYTLRNRNYNKIFIPKTSDLNERHFLIRVLYKHCYWLGL